MTAPRSRTRGRPSVLVAAGLAVAMALSTAVPAAAADYPSWSDVQRARNDQAATKALVARLDRSLQDAQERAAALSDAALKATAAAGKARADADAAAARAQQLRSLHDAARARFEDARRALGVVAAGRYREESTGPLVPRLLTDPRAGDLLARLTLMDRLERTWSDLAGTARREASRVASLQVEADRVEAESADLASAADRAAAQAQAAADTEGSAVAGLSEQVDTMYAQLASLKDTTASVERDYRLGQQVAAQEAEAARAPAAGGGGSGGGGPAGGTGSGGTSPGGPSYGVIVDADGARAYAHGAVVGRGWSEDDYQCLVRLWNRESGWRADARNPSSGAYGIPQALPAEKMAAAGPDWRTNGRTQIDWGLSYIAQRYGTPCGAWGHSEDTGWY